MCFLCKHEIYINAATILNECIFLVLHEGIPNSCKVPTRHVFVLPTINLMTRMEYIAMTSSVLVSLTACADELASIGSSAIIKPSRTSCMIKMPSSTAAKSDGALVPKEKE